MKGDRAFEDMVVRIQQAETEEDLEVVSDLLDMLGQCDMITSSMYRELDFMIDDRLSTLVLEGKI